MEVREGFKQTSLGEFPTEWGEASIGAYKPFVTSGSRGWARFYSSNGDLFIRITNMCRDSISLDLSDSCFVRLPEAEHEGERTQLAVGDLLVSITADIGIVSYVDNSLPLPAYINQHIAIVRFPEKSIDAKFAAYFLAHGPGQRTFRAITDQGAKAGINLQTVRSIPIVVPEDVDEQRAIATALSDVDALLEGLDRLIAKKRDLKQAAMQQLLTGRRRLPGFGETWDSKPMGDLFSIFAGKSKSAFITNGGQYWVVDMGSVSINGKLIVSKETNYCGDFLKIGDLVMPKDDIGGGNIIGKVGYIDAENSYVLGDHVYCLRAKQGHPLFLSYVINGYSTNIALRKKAIGSAQLGLGRRSVEEQEVPFPDPKEQSAIATVLSDMDAELSALEARRDKTRALKQGMMQELLTGRIRLVESGTRACEQSAPQTDGQQANIHFRRSVLAAEIIDRLHAEPTFGHVKFEKVMFLVEHLCAVETGSTYLRKAAGPYDNRALRSIDSQLRKQQWFDCRKEGERYRYMPMEHRGGYKRYFERYFADITDTFENVLQTFKTLETERCEIVATLLSAWGDLLQAEGDVSDERIVHEVLNNWHKSKERIPKDRWLKALGWMRSRGFVPNRGAKP